MFIPSPKDNSPSTSTSASTSASASTSTPPEETAEAAKAAEAAEKAAEAAEAAEAAKTQAALTPAVFQVFEAADTDGLELGHAHGLGPRAGGLSEAACLGVFVAATVVAVLLIWLVCSINEDGQISRSPSATLLVPQPLPHEKARRARERSE